MRLRAGLGGTAGVFLPGPMIAFGASGRLGAQFNEMLAAYLDVGQRSGFWIGISISGGNVSQSVSGLGYTHIGAMGELTLGDVFFVAAGPMVARGGWGSIQQEVQGSDVRQYVVVAGGGFSPGADFRLGFGFGKPKADGRRGQITVAVDCQFILARVASVSQEAGSGGASQSIRVGDSTVGITPQLTIGYDWK